MNFRERRKDCHYFYVEVLESGKCKEKPNDYTINRVRKEFEVRFKTTVLKKFNCFNEACHYFEEVQNG